MAESLQQHSNGLTCESLWFAYQRRFPNSVRGNAEQRTDLISIVRFAMGYNAFLDPFSVTVNRNFREWITGKDFNTEQHRWLELIRDHIATSLDIRMSDFEYAPFAELGNGAKVYELFGDDLDDILTELTAQLVSLGVTFGWDLGLFSFCFVAQTFSLRIPNPHKLKVCGTRYLCCGS